MTKSKFRKWAAGLIGGGLLGFAVGYFGERLMPPDVSAAAGGSIKDRLGFWLIPLSIISALLLATLVIAIHELGHLIGGLMARLRFHFYVVGPLRVERSDYDRIRVTLNTDVAFAGGVVAMLPTDMADLRRRMLFMIGGGPAASLLFGVACLAIPNGMARIAAVFSLLIFIATAIPMTTGGMATDGARVMRLLGAGPMAQREAALMPLVAMWGAGVPPREWPADLVQQSLAIEDGSVDEYNAYVLAYSHALDGGDTGTARSHLARARQLVEGLPDAFRPSLYVEDAYFAARHDRDVVRARELLAKVPKRALGVTAYERARADAAILAAEGDIVQARRVAMDALAAAPPSNAFARARLAELAGPDV